MATANRRAQMVLRVQVTISACQDIARTGFAVLEVTVVKLPVTATMITANLRYVQSPSHVKVSVAIRHAVPVDVS